MTCPLYVTCISACHLPSGAQRNRVASVWNVTTSRGRGKGNVPEQILSPPTAAQRRQVLFPSTGSGQNKSRGKSDIKGPRRENASFHPRKGQLYLEQ